jgi:hypothetical protein
MKWVFPQRRVDGKNVPNEKAIPFRIPLGNRTEALAIIEKIRAALGGFPKQPDARPGSSDVDDGDIPF